MFAFRRVILKEQHTAFTLGKRKFWSGDRGGVRKPSFLRDTSSNLLGNGGGKSVLWAIVGANAMVFLAWSYTESASGSVMLRKRLINDFTVSSAGVLNYGKIHTLLTATFSHKDFMHVGFNMLAFYSFGNQLLYLLPVPQFLALYLGGGLVSSLCQVYWPYIVPRSWPASRYISPHDRSLGASGAVNAIVMYNIMSFPKATVLLYGIVPLPAALLGLAFIGIDAYSLYKGNSGMGNAAHLGGAAFGALAFLLTRGRFRRF
ncbi:rhomboid family intramembrane serine protease [archaeon]|nr:MAG: rhomboid family intramembrane serine protease [archaeon]